jgi:FkbM family methyltransferase
MIEDQSLDARLARPQVPGVSGFAKSPAGGIAVRRRLQSAVFPLIDANCPVLTHQLRLMYNFTLRRGEVELRHVRFLVDRKRTAIDIGAHRGIYAHVLAQRAKHVHAFEPHPQLYSYLRRVMPAKVTVHPIALSSAAGVVTFRIPRAGSYLGLGQGTLEAMPIFHASAVSEIEVRSSTLDREVAEPVGFMKIDVEGHELSVLEGGRDILRRDQPALMVEIADNPSLQHYRRVLDFLAGFGYRPFSLERGGLVSVANRGPTDAFARMRGPAGDILCANFIFLA